MAIPSSLTRANAESRPVWSPDGSRILYTGADFNLYQTSATGSGPEQLVLGSLRFAFASDWSADCDGARDAHPTGFESDYPQSDDEALKLYRPASRTIAIARNNLATLLANAPPGSSDPSRDQTTIATLYKRAAAQGMPLAQANLGRLYFFGVGVAQDYDEAARWLIPAAAANIADAQNLLGDLYKSGLGVARDEQKGERLVRLAADQGHADALSAIAPLGRELPARLHGELHCGP